MRRIRVVSGGAKRPRMSDEDERMLYELRGRYRRLFEDQIMPLILNVHPQFPDIRDTNVVPYLSAIELGAPGRYIPRLNQLMNDIWAHRNLWPQENFIKIWEYMEFVLDALDRMLDEELIAGARRYIREASLERSDLPYEEVSIDYKYPHFPW
jgi:hypothetical protein